MSKMTRQIVRCAVCGNKVNETIFLSSNAFGYSDLDFRPSEMMRSAMFMMVNMCPHCHYSNYHLNELMYPDVAKIVKSDTYQSLVASLYDRTSQKMFLHAYLYKAKDMKIKAIESFKRAAWAFDDIGDRNMSKKCREQALNMLEEFKDKSVSYAMIYIDMNRRIGQFDKALEHIDKYIDTELPQKEDKLWFSFEKKLCLKKDDKVHNCGEFLRGER